MKQPAFFFLMDPLDLNMTAAEAGLFNLANIKVSSTKSLVES